MGRNSDGLDRARGVRRAVMSVMSAVAACAMVLGGAVAGAAGQCEPRWTRGVRAWNTVDSQFVAGMMLLGDAGGGGGVGRVLFAGRVANPADGSLTVVGIWNAADQSVQPLAREVNGYLRTVTKLPGGDVVVGGAFTSIDGAAVRQVARWNGTNWAAMGTELGGTVEKLLVLADGSIVAMGSISAVGANPIRGIARWDGAAWRSMGDGLSGTLRDVVELPGGGLLVSGSFTQSGIAGIAQWSGRSWVGFGGITSGSAGPMEVMADGSLVVGSNSLTTNRAALGAVSRWDGQQWSTLGGLAGSVADLSVTPDGGLLATGLLSITGRGTAVAARWDGSSWNSLGNPQITSPQRAIGLPGGDVMLAPSRGDETLGPVVRYLTAGEPVTITRQPEVVVTCPGRVAELEVEASGAPLPRFQWQRNHQAIPPSVNATALTPVLRFDAVTRNDGGWYTCEVTNGCGSVTSRLVWLHVGPCACSIADVAGGPLANVKNPDAMVDGNDFVAFINAFAIGDAVVGPQADVAGGGVDGLEPDGTVDAADFVEFVNAFVAGC
jgi:hypothetical protein